MTSLSGQKDPVSPIVIGSLPARDIMTTAGNTAHAEGRVLTKSDPVTSVTGADLAADGVTRATAPVWGAQGSPAGPAGCARRSRTISGYGRAMTEGQGVTAAAARDPGARVSAGPAAGARPVPAEAAPSPPSSPAPPSPSSAAPSPQSSAAPSPPPSAAPPPARRSSVPPSPAQAPAPQ